MDKVQIELIGCGLFGESHLRALSAVRAAQIAVVCDTDSAHAIRSPPSSASAESASLGKRSARLDDAFKLAGDTGPSN